MKRTTGSIVDPIISNIQKADKGLMKSLDALNNAIAVFQGHTAALNMADFKKPVYNFLSGVIPNLEACISRSKEASSLFSDTTSYLSSFKSGALASYEKKRGRKPFIFAPCFVSLHKASRHLIMANKALISISSFLTSGNNYSMPAKVLSKFIALLTSASNSFRASNNLITDCNDTLASWKDTGIPS